MSLAVRLDQIKNRGLDARVVWNERTALSWRPRVGFGFNRQIERALRPPPAKWSAKDLRIVFLDFCPGGVLRNRLDIDWIQGGFCAYEFFSSDAQWELFQSIAIGDLLVIKRTRKFDSATRLHAYGRVFGLDVSDKGERVLKVDWAHEQEQIDVPPFQTDEKVVIHNVTTLQATMPPAFWAWLQK
jgi:hypothetical protein